MARSQQFWQITSRGQADPLLRSRRGAGTCAPCVFRSGPYLDGRGLSLGPEAGSCQLVEPTDRGLVSLSAAGTSCSLRIPLAMESNHRPQQYQVRGAQPVPPRLFKRYLLKRSFGLTLPPREDLWPYTRGVCAFQYVSERRVARQQTETAP
jgi:hypothetical protein